MDRKTIGYKEENTHSNGRRNAVSREGDDSKASSVTDRNVQDRDIMELQEKVKKLQEEFSSLPKVLIRKTLCDDDVNGDLAKARQRLQEFRQINDPLLRSQPVAAKPLTRSSKGDLEDSQVVMNWIRSEKQNQISEGKIVGKAPRTFVLYKFHMAIFSFSYIFHLLDSCFSSR